MTLDIAPGGALLVPLVLSLGASGSGGDVRRRGPPGAFAASVLNPRRD